MSKPVAVMDLPVLVQVGDEMFEVGTLELDVTAGADGKLRLPSSRAICKALRKAEC